MKKIITILFILAFSPLNLYPQWVQISSPTSNTLYSVFFNNASTGYVSGSLSGTVIKTINGGTSWTFLSTGSSSTFYDLCFTNLQTGFVGGTSKQIIKSTNAGANWDIKTSGSGTIYSLSGTGSVFYGVGGSPTVLDKSTDGGNNWTLLTPPTTYTLRGCWFETSTLGWVCGYSGTLWKTTDGCVSWIPQLQSTSYNFEKLYFINSTTGYVAGSGGTILKTTNGGTNWTPVTTNTTNTLYDIFLTSAATGWAVGSGGTIIKTTNSGNNWYSQTGSGGTLYAIHMADANTGYIVGSGGVILKTTNGGGVPYVPFFVKLQNDPITITTNASNQCAWGDYDNDGLTDIVISTFNDNCWTCDYPLLLFRNIGQGFQRVMTAPIATVTSKTFGVCWGDYDNDDKIDLFVSVGFSGNNLLFHNEGNGNFTQIISGSIVNDGGESRGCAWVDYDRDGWLDLFVCNQNNQNNCLYHNNQNGTFTKIASGSIVNDANFTRGCAWGDYNNDGWPDLFAVNYSGQNDDLYRNNGNGTFTKILSGPEVNDQSWGTTCSWGDYDNDGYLDLYVTNNNQLNRLYHNEGNGNFTLVSGGPSSETGYSFGTSWADYDNDGYLDLFMAKEYTFNALYKNNSGQSFTKITNEPPTMEGGLSVGCAWSDFFSNGKIDLFVTNNNLLSVNYMYINQGNTGNYLVLKLHGCLTETGRSNTNAIGARIKVQKVNQTFYREVCGGNGSEDMFWQHFGLGSITNVDSIVVNWPSGNVQKLTNVPVNQTILIDECLLGVPNNNNQVPAEYSLEQNFPNPFNPTTTINYSLKKQTHVRITVYDIMGRFVKTLVDATEPTGKYKTVFDGSDIRILQNKKPRSNNRQHIRDTYALRNSCSFCTHNEQLYLSA